MIILILSSLILICIKYTLAFNWQDVQLPLKHISIFFNNNPSLKEECLEDLHCPFKAQLHEDIPVCWGYEDGCSRNVSYSQPTCPGHHKGWVSSKEEQLSTFFDQGDFGYVKHHRDQLTPYCEGDGESRLECSDHLQFCKGKNIMVDFRGLVGRKVPVRYHMDVLKEGEIGGNCRLNKALLSKNTDLISPLQSWGPELRHFVEVKAKIEEGREGSAVCDIWVEKPTVITKIDASVSMYHHFCDFVNLYASQHVNNSGPHAFMTDVQVLIWEQYPYSSNFALAWKAFTKNPIWNLNKVSGKRVCFSNVVFPLLPRMIFGLYYNTPIIYGCEKSGLFSAFSEHMKHRLSIPKRTKRDRKVHVTFLSRQTKHRRILNEEHLLRAIRTDHNLDVRKVEFTHGDSFLDQVKQDQWTDILIGMHGAGLTHVLFLPDWAALIELYDCGDSNCYKDLARLRGVAHLSWTEKNKMFPEDQGHHPDLGAHEKFTNYRFDPEEFVKLVRKAARLVRQHPAWKALANSDKKQKDEL